MPARIKFVVTAPSLGAGLFWNRKRRLLMEPDSQTDDPGQAVISTTASVLVDLQVALQAHVADTKQQPGHDPLEPAHYELVVR